MASPAFANIVLVEVTIPDAAAEILFARVGAVYGV